MWKKKAWLPFAEAVSKFLAALKYSDNQNIVETCQLVLKHLDVACLKVRFLHAHLGYFPQNFGDMSKEHGERFHQDIKIIKTRL